MAAFTRRLCVVVTCMGRLAFLRRTLPAVLATSDGSYCLVDYSCPDRVGEWARSEFRGEYERGRLIVASMGDRSTFHKAEAINFGARHAIEHGAEYLCFLDADTMPNREFFSFVQGHLAPDRFMVDLYGRSLFGFLLLASTAFQRSGGFDENIRGYGGEDIEMRLRLHLVLGLSYLALPPGLLRGLPHGDELRTQHYPEKRREVSNAENLAYVRGRVRQWTARELFDLEPGVINLYRTPPEQGKPIPTANLRTRRRALVRARLRGR